MKNYVQRVLVGAGVPWAAGVNPAENEVMAFDWDTKLICDSTTTKVGLKCGNLGGIVVGPIGSRLESHNFSSAYRAGTPSAPTITVTGLPAAGQPTDFVFKVIIHDNLSIIPNQIKQVMAAVSSEGAADADAFADKIAAALNVAQGDRNVFNATAAAGVITVTAANVGDYNDITRPEIIVLEIANIEGPFTFGAGTAMVTPNGTPDQVMWLEDLHAGRYGFSDRTNWNSKKYPHQAKDGETYSMYSIDALIPVEGDMQDVRLNPVGAIMALTAVDIAFTDELTAAGISFDGV
jgi:hypothetical protein